MSQTVSIRVFIGAFRIEISFFWPPSANACVPIGTGMSLSLLHIQCTAAGVNGHLGFAEGETKKCIVSVIGK
jgi:hypothetical protein